MSLFWAQNSLSETKQIFGRRSTLQNLRSTVSLVSKDINLRLKAKSLDILAEDYETGKIKNIVELENTGKYLLEDLDPLAINSLAFL